MSDFDYSRRIRNYPVKGEGYYIALEKANLKEATNEKAVDAQELFESLNPQLRKGD